MGRYERSLFCFISNLIIADWGNICEGYMAQLKYEKKLASLPKKHESGCEYLVLNTQKLWYINASSAVFCKLLNSVLSEMQPSVITCSSMPYFMILTANINFFLWALYASPT